MSFLTELFTVKYCGVDFDLEPASAAMLKPFLFAKAGINLSKNPTIIWIFNVELATLFCVLD